MKIVLEVEVTRKEGPPSNQKVLGETLSSIFEAYEFQVGIENYSVYDITKVRPL